MVKASKTDPAVPDCSSCRAPARLRQAVAASLELDSCYGRTSGSGRGWHRIQLSTHFTDQVSDRVGVAQNDVGSQVHLPWIQEGVASLIHRFAARRFEDVLTHMLQPLNRVQTDP